MSSWRWRYERTDGSEVVDVAVTPGHSEGGNEALASASGEFPSQADAESWIGETWADLLEQGVDIRVIQVLLGHVNINTTGIYTQVSSKTMRAVTSPLDQIVAVMEGRAPPG